MTCAKLEIGPGESTSHPQETPAALLDPALYFGAHPDPELPQDATISNFDELLNVCQKHDKTLYPDEKAILRQFELILKYKNFWKDVIVNLNPKYIFYRCYFDPMHMGLNLASDKPLTIDIQHGKIGPLQGTYTPYTAIPSDGYGMLPDFFWVWGERVKQNILVGRNRTDLHQPIIGGNRWLARWIEAPPAASLEKERALEKLKTRYNRILLYTMQPLHNSKDTIPPQLIEAVRQSPSDWLWMFRTHPKARNQVKEIQQAFADMGNRVEWRIASTESLYRLLPFIDAHLTCWSSVVHEAIVFKTWTIIIHPNGYDNFASDIENGLIKYAETPESIRRTIEGCFASPPPHEDQPYIETSETVAVDALDAIENAYVARSV